MRCVVLLSAVFSAVLFACGKEEPAPPVPETEVEVNLDKTALLNKVNAIRATGCTCGQTVMPPVPALSWNNLLAQAALNHSRDMNSNDFFDHVSSDGRDVGTRITQTGYIWSTVGENIAYGQRNETEVFNSWLKSEGHCKNMMNARFREMGAGRAGNYWTQDFGTRR